MHNFVFADHAVEKNEHSVPAKLASYCDGSEGKLAAMIIIESPSMNKHYKTLIRYLIRFLPGLRQIQWRLFNNESNDCHDAT